ncbi:MAG: hypothetical protein SPG09_09505 [Lachnospiraceae bacterium]|nr:hypothetical protein [Lachnospiraceae bacterium]
MSHDTVLITQCGSHYRDK